MSRWLEPPMKLQDAVNVLHRAISERSGDGSQVNGFGNIPTPSRKETARNNMYDENLCSSWFDLAWRIRDLIRSALILSSDLGKWAKPFPYYYRNEDEVISEILSNSGISPDDFLGARKTPIHLANSKYLNACYILVNHVYKSASFASIFSRYNYTYHAYGVDGTGVGTGLRRIIYRAEEYNQHFRRFTSGELSTDADFILKQWSVKAQMLGNFIVDGVVEQTVEYEQVFNFNNGKADAPTLLGDYIDISDHDYRYYEYVDLLPGYEIADSFLLYSNRSEVLFTADNFSKLQYYDPPQ